MDFKSIPALIWVPFFLLVVFIPGFSLKTIQKRTVNVLQTTTITTNISPISPRKNENFNEKAIKEITKKMKSLLKDDINDKTIPRRLVVMAAPRTRKMEGIEATLLRLKKETKLQKITVSVDDVITAPTVTDAFVEGDDASETVMTTSDDSLPTTMLILNAETTPIVTKKPTTTAFTKFNATFSLNRKNLFSNVPQDKRLNVTLTRMNNPKLSGAEISRTKCTNSGTIDLPFHQFEEQRADGIVTPTTMAIKFTNVVDITDSGQIFNFRGDKILSKSNINSKHHNCSNSSQHFGNNRSGSNNNVTNNRIINKAVHDKYNKDCNHFYEINNSAILDEAFSTQLPTSKINNKLKHEINQIESEAPSKHYVKKFGQHATPVPYRINTELATKDAFNNGSFDEINSMKYLKTNQLSTLSSQTLAFTTTPHPLSLNNSATLQNIALPTSAASSYHSVTTLLKGTKALTEKPLHIISTTTLKSSPTVDDFRTIISQAGNPAYLPCNVKQLVKKPISWLRVRDGHILTVDQTTFIADERFQSIFSSNPEHWSLQIKNVQIKDAGTYECQVSTEPKSSALVFLQVIEPKTELIGESTRHVKAGSQVKLSCIISQALEPPLFINWFYNQKQIFLNNRKGWRTEIELIDLPPETLKTTTIVLTSTVPKYDPNFSSSSTIATPTTQDATIASDVEINSIGVENELNTVFQSTTIATASTYFTSSTLHNDKNIAFVTSTTSDTLVPSPPSSFLSSSVPIPTEMVMSDSVEKVGDVKQITAASLIIPSIGKQDTGNYTCSPSNSSPRTIVLHVLNGEYSASAITSGSISNIIIMPYKTFKQWQFLTLLWLIKFFVKLNPSINFNGIIYGSSNQWYISKKLVSLQLQKELE